MNFLYDVVINYFIILNHILFLKKIMNTKYYSVYDNNKIISHTKYWIQWI